MPRNAEHARTRLRHAALELFAEHGFEGTTAAQIAARAGVTERTFFRHFSDKREVLFDSQDALGKALSEAIAKAPPDLAPIQTLHWAYASVIGIFEDNRKYSEPRQRIIAKTPSLQEREIAKHAALTRTVSQALQRRGVEKGRAELAAQAGSAVLNHALASWFAAPSENLGDCLDRAFAELQALSSPMAAR